MKKAFTIVELVITLAIIGILSATLVSTFQSFKDKMPENEITINEQLNKYKEILEKYGIDTSNLTEEEIEKIIEELKFISKEEIPLC